MSTQHAVEFEQAEIRQRIDQLLEAIRAADLERLKPLYAPQMVSFDLPPPLRHVGAEAKWRNWQQFFTVYEHPVGYEIHDLTVIPGAVVACAHGLGHISATMKDGNKNDYWVRVTFCFVKVDGTWLIAHDHVSVPLDLASLSDGRAKALLNLEP